MLQETVELMLLSEQTESHVFDVGTNQSHVADAGTHKSCVVDAGTKQKPFQISCVEANIRV